MFASPLASRIDRQAALGRAATERAVKEGASRARALLRVASMADSVTSRRSTEGGRFSRRRSDSRTNHRITLERPPSPDELSASGLPAVRMSPLGNIVLPSTFHFEPIEDDGASAFSQAGGHSGSFRSDGPALEKKVSEREARFYEEAQEGKWPVQFLPRFFGRSMMAGEPAIKIENLTHGMRRPCIMDLKMGFQSVEASERRVLKRLRHAALDHLTGSKHSGVRLEGLSMYRSLEKKRMKGNRVQSHAVSANMGVSLQDVLTFFLTDESGVRIDIALRFQAHIEALLHYFTRYNKDRLFIGSSILLIYDNDNSSPHMRWARALQRLHTVSDAHPLSSDRVSSLTRRTHVDVRMIDFAHTGNLPRGQTRDLGYIQGLQTVLEALKAIRSHRTRPMISSVANVAMNAMSKRASAAGEDDVSPNKQTADTSDEECPAFNFAALYEQCSAVSVDSTPV